MGKWKIISAGSIILLLSLSCAEERIVATPAAPLATASFTPISTLTPGSPPKPAHTAIVTSPSPTSTKEAGSFSPYFVQTTADNVNLRILPGTLFPVSRLLAKGTRLQVWGHAPGGDWIYVQTDEHIYGWVLSGLLNGGQDSGPSPEVQPQNVQLVSGRVVDLSGVPISGIGFAITQGTGPNAPRTDATTDKTGQFYAFLPPSASGQWFVTYVSVSCTSNTMDANCNCIGGHCGKSDPNSVPVILPIKEPLQFVWK